MLKEGVRVDEEERRKITASVPHLSKHGRKFDRAIETVLMGGVKECRFVPSGRRIVSVVGTLGDEFVDPGKPFCSCGDFFFRVTKGREELCYHLLSYSIAATTGRVSVLEFDDAEYGGYLAAVIGDVFNVMEREG
jgi:predicted nucleic acid-binding Zn finger protein